VNIVKKICKLTDFYKSRGLLGKEFSVRTKKTEKRQGNTE
jgi:hypothetical protein